MKTDIQAIQTKYDSKAKSIHTIDTVPADLAAHIGDHDGFTVYGYDIAPKTTIERTLDGEPFTPSGDGRIMRYFAAKLGDGPRPEWVDRVIETKTTCDWYYAVVAGNAVSAESYFKSHGYKAFAGSPNYVSVRPVTEVA